MKQDVISNHRLPLVAPHTGAWIETSIGIGAADMHGSHPTRVRGLKRIHPISPNGIKVAPHTGAWIETLIFTTYFAEALSHPTRVRGLKRYNKRPAPSRDLSHPTRVRGLKLSPSAPKANQHTSHPTRVRGLKHKNSRLPVYFKVAPHTGAWIETLRCL